MIEIFGISFIVALTGALFPGPVLTFTIYKSFKSKNPFGLRTLRIYSNTFIIRYLDFSLVSETI